MKDVLVPIPRFEPWDTINQQDNRQDYALIKDSGISPEKSIRAWIFKNNEPLIEGQWISGFRFIVGCMTLNEAVMVDPDIRGGAPVLRGTRIGVSQIVIDLADGETVDGIAVEYDIDAEMIKKFLEGLAIALDRSYLP